MTLRDALLADTERRGVRRKIWADPTCRIVPLGYRWELFHELIFDRVEVYAVTEFDVVADDWEVCA